MNQLSKEIIDRLIEKADVWNDEIKPYVLKGLHQGYRMATKDQASRALPLLEALESIREYWNEDRNESAMYDACCHAIKKAEEALQNYNK